MPPLFEFEAADLLIKAEKEVTAFYDSADLGTLFNALASLNHLREWVCPHACEARRGQPDWPVTPAEKLFQNLWDNDSFKVVRALCNGAKHFEVKPGYPETKSIEGMQIGIARVGDRFGQTYRLANGDDVRILLMDVLRMYTAYFDEHEPGWRSAETSC